ncbi:MAG: CsgG/HfaB family protein [Treponema sp.]|jgi:hypothetical protein|nr:CsgG/HfaB family protein [Treponema sp.]
MKKKWIWTLISAFTGCLLLSCISLNDRVMTEEERASAEVIGSVTAQFGTLNFLHIRSQANIKSRALAELRREALKRYPGNVDIRNITISGSFSAWNLLWGMFYFASPVLLDVQRITASGEVVQYTSASGAGAAPGTGRVDQQRLQEALAKAGDALIEGMPRNTTIAILSMSALSREISEYLIDELEYRLVESRKFTIVDRRRLDQIRSEQNFQTSGEVDDNSAVSIGNMLGANIVVTGAISTGTTRYLSLRALDVNTAQILTIAREQL